VFCQYGCNNVELCVKEEDDYENKAGSTQGRRAWDDEFVLKRQFMALIPAFDPRPGRTNVNQTQDYSIPAPGSTESSQSEVVETVAQPKLGLFMRGPSQPGVCKHFLLIIECHIPVVTISVYILLIKLFLFM